MPKFLLFASAVLTLLTRQSPAAPLSRAEACEKKNQIQMQMQVIASNVANRNTTRTPEGGPYVWKRLRCKDLNCQLIEERRVKMVYEPEHPDANTQGYVAYPNIDVHKEILRMTKAVVRYDRVAALCDGAAE